MEEQNEQIGRSGFERFGHVCVLYSSEEERYRVLEHFVREGFPRGDKALHIIDGARRGEHLSRLNALGVDVAGAQKTGQLEVRAWEQAHLRPGWFDQEAMLELVEQVLAEARAGGFPFTRWVADMGWALGGCRGAQDVAPYCSRLNEVVPRHAATVVCSYDVTRFSAATVLDVLRTHPVAVIGGVAHENPFYVPPDELLREFSERAAAPLS